jgi:hypothetical protein
MGLLSPAGGFAVFIASEWRLLAGVVALSLGIVLAVLSPFFAFRPYRPGGRPLPNMRRIRRRFVLASELTAGACIFAGVSGIAPNSIVKEVSIALVALCTSASLFVRLAAYRLESHSAASARKAPLEEETEEKTE